MMPSSQDSNGENSSKLEMLERFRYITNKGRPSSESVSSTWTNGSQDVPPVGEPEENVDLSTKMKLSLLKSAWNYVPEGATSRNSVSPERNHNGVTIIPETPDHARSPSSTDDTNGFKAGSDSESEEPVVAKTKKVKRALITDSESDSDDQQATKKVKIGSNTTVNSQETVLNSDDQVELQESLSDKEKGLRTLMKTFPKMDLMKLQDTLVSCDWHVDMAIQKLQDELAKESDSSSESETESKDNVVTFTNVTETWGKETALKNPMGLDSVTSSQSTYLPQLSDTQSSTDDILSKKEPDNQLNSDSENTNTNIQSTESPVVKRRVVRQRIHQLSSDSESDDNDDGVKIISMTSLEQERPPPQLKIVRQNDHQISSNEDEETNKSKPSSPEPADGKRKKKKKKKKHRRKDVEDASDDGEDFAGDELYDSDNSDIDDELNSAREAVLNFFRNAPFAELLSVPGCSKKKVDVITSLRPFKGWADLVIKLQTSRSLSTDLLGAARDVIVTREVMTKLMQKCEKIASDMEKVVTQMNLKGSKGNCIKEQPHILTTSMALSSYQMLGLNWLWVMHRRHLNGILADEMGLGKTIQAISFLAQLKITDKKPGKHLVIVPSSTLDNWLREIHTWCPAMEVVVYHGSQEQRRELRLQLINDELEDYDIILTTYNMLSSSTEDRTLFRRLEFHYVIFDEAHMLKNMNTQRYQNLMKIRADRRLLLTGTPLQNNLVELMSLLIFVMPDMFRGKIEQVKQMFTAACKSEENRSDYEKDRIEHAKRIMKPFVLRRLKREVLKELPTKHEEVLDCYFTPRQKELYTNLVETFTKRVSEEESKGQGAIRTNGVGMMMELRKAANHPLLIRKIFTDSLLREMSKKLLDEPVYAEASADIIYEDMEVMSDFELHRLCKNFKSISTYKLQSEVILDSGKFQALDNLLPGLKETGLRFLLFSQFTMMLDIVEEYMAIRNYSYVRLDGSTPVTERQELMDRFNGDPEIFAFLLSTKAGGLGINLTAANVVLLHDIDFNPYNDKQAEDRCHRLGQTKEVFVKKMIMKESIEEAILKCAMDKLKLERDITADNGEDAEEENKTVGNLLKTALGL